MGEAKVVPIALRGELMTDETQPAAATKIFELFEEGKHFTEELLKENERLRLINAQLKNEKRDVESQYVRVDVPRLQEKLRVFEEEIVGLRKENEELRSQFSSVEEENREFADRYISVERQNSDLVNLYVASYRLHSTLDYAEVVEIIKEIVINMIGSEMFGIYACDEKEKRLVLIGHEGLDQTIAETIPIGAGIVGGVAESGELYSDKKAASRDDGEPVACIPLKIGERLLGVIAIYQLLLQKQSFQPLDFELFELLGGHAATAMYVARLYGLSERKRSTLEGFIDLLKRPTTNGVPEE